MRLLLDTHALIWWDIGRLPAKVATMIKEADEVYVSAVSAWEIAIKASLGRIVPRGSIATAIADYGFSELSITVAHADHVSGLPPHHRDPFDRLLAAQATVEGLTLVTRDPLFTPYGIETRWA